MFHIRHSGYGLSACFFIVKICMGCELIWM
nr:MAG TPA: protein of unknown function (DUF4514) [Caudoviricetes sp.]